MSIDPTYPSPALPDVDERLVAPDSGFEILDGVVVPVPPADEPHATQQSKIAALFEAHTHADYDVATDMLTRTSKIDDFAPDVSVFARERDPVTGARRLEELVVEIISTQKVANAATKAAKLSERGVRRVFGIDITRGRLLEWSRDLETWSILDPNVDLVDPVFAVPLRLAALLDAGRTDDVVAKALVARHNSVFAAELERMRRETIIDGLFGVLEAREVQVSDAQWERIREEHDPARLARWLVVAATCADAASLFDD